MSYILTSTKLDKNKDYSDEEILDSEFFVYRYCYSKENDLEGIVTNAFWWFKQSSKPLYVYIYSKSDYFKSNFKNIIKYSNLCLLNDNNIDINDCRLIKKENLKYSINIIKGIIIDNNDNDYHNGIIEIEL